VQHLVAGDHLLEPVEPLIGDVVQVDAPVVGKVAAEDAEPLGARRAHLVERGLLLDLRSAGVEEEAAIVGELCTVGVPHDRGIRLVPPDRELVDDALLVAEHPHRAEHDRGGHHDAEQQRDRAAGPEPGALRHRGRVGGLGGHRITLRERPAPLVSAR
jgi:hypothetical protein